MTFRPSTPIDFSHLRRTPAGIRSAHDVAREYMARIAPPAPEARRHQLLDDELTPLGTDGRPRPAASAEGVIAAGARARGEQPPSLRLVEPPPQPSRKLATAAEMLAAMKPTPIRAEDRKLPGGDA